MTFFAFFTLILAAVLEVGGDAMIRDGIKDKSLFYLAAGVGLLALYGLFVNVLSTQSVISRLVNFNFRSLPGANDWQFSNQLGLYVGFFALASVGWGHSRYGDTVSASTIVGLFLIGLGGLTMQYGQKIWMIFRG